MAWSASGIRFAGPMGSAVEASPCRQLLLRNSRVMKRIPSSEISCAKPVFGISSCQIVSKGRVIVGQASSSETPPTSTTIDSFGSSEKVLVPGVKSDNSVSLSNNASHDTKTNDELIEDIKEETTKSIQMEERLIIYLELCPHLGVAKKYMK